MCYTSIGRARKFDFSYTRPHEGWKILVVTKTDKISFGQLEQIRMFVVYPKICCTDKNNSNVLK